EREIARLAALNASEGDLAEIRGALDAQEVALARGNPANPEDIRFHNAIASASGNRVLRNALALMRRDESLADLMVRLRRLRRSPDRGGSGRGSAARRREPATVSRAA